MKMKVLISKERYGEKPKNPGSLQTLNAFTECDLSVQEFAEKVGSGHAWRAGLYGEDGGSSVKKEHVKHASAIALDFDDCPHNPSAVASFAKDKIGYRPNVIYATYSQDGEEWYRRKSPRLVSNLISDGENRASTCGVGTSFSFRFVWFLEEPIDPESYELVQAALTDDVFADFKPDKSTKDPSRLWYGGVLGAETVCKNPMPLKALYPLLEAGKSRQKARKGGADGSLRDSGDAGEPLPESDVESVYVTDGWQEILRPRCELFRRFVDGDYLNFNERLWLLSNLKHLKYRSHNGRSILKELLPTTDYPVYQGHTYCERQLREMLKAKGCLPYPCVETLDGRWLTVPEFFSGCPEEQFAIPNIDKCSLEELDEWMCGIPAMLANGEMLYIKSQTASGKTEQIVRYLASSASESLGKIIYAAPTHQNIREMEERIRRKCEELGTIVEVIASPKGVYTDNDIKRMRVGLPKRSQSEERKTFLKQLYDEQIGGVFLITHSLLVNLDSVPCARIIIDENPEDSLVKLEELNIKSLGNILLYLSEKSRRSLLEFTDSIAGVREGSLLDTSVLDGVMDELIEKLKYQGDECESLLDAIPACFFNLTSKPCRKVGKDAIAMMFRSPIIDAAIANGIPIKILTATPKSAKLEAYYGDFFTMKEAPMAANKGRIVQYLGMSGAKGRGCEKIPALAEYIRSRLTKEQIDDSYVISFKESADTWRELGFNVYTNDDIDIHLANNAGLDCLKGKKVIVAGKYDTPDSTYKTQAYFIREHNLEEVTRQNVVKDFYGVKRSVYLFEDAIIQGIQTEGISCMTQQAAGRVRALREKDANVYVFCDIPIPEADEYRYQ